MSYDVERRRSRRIDVALGGTVKSQQDNDMTACVIRNINEGCSGVAVSTFDPRVCVIKDLVLNIAIPAGRSPVRCTGRIAWYSEDSPPGGRYKAGISITEISGIDRRKLELVIAFSETQMQSDGEI